MYKNSTLDDALEKWLWNLVRTAQDPVHGKKLERLDYTKDHIMQAVLADRKQHELDAIKRVDRFEVIDDTGRAYVKGSIYGSPVKVELSYQDDGRTLKVFVEPRKEQS